MIQRRDATTTWQMTVPWPWVLLKSLWLLAPWHPGQGYFLPTPSSQMEDAALGLQHLFSPMFHLSLLFYYCIKNGRPTSIIIWRKCQLLALTDLMALTPVDWVTVGSLVCHRVGKCSYVKRKRQKLEGLQKYINILIPLLQCLHLHDPHLKFHLIC